MTTPIHIYVNKVYKNVSHLFNIIKVILNYK